MLKRLSLFVSVLKVLSKFYKLILARADLKRGTSASDDDDVGFPFSFSPRFILFLVSAPFSPSLWPTLERRRKISGVHGVHGVHVSRLSLSFRPSVLHYAHTSPSASFVPGRTSGHTNAKRSQGRGREGGREGEGGAEIHRRGERGERWSRRRRRTRGRKCGGRNKDRRLITTTSLNKHV